MMKLRPWRNALLGVTLLLLGLTACSQPADRQPAVEYSPNEMMSAIEGVGTSARNILDGATFGLGGRTADSLLTGLPASETPNRLLRGVYVWNEVDAAWDFVESSDLLMLRWPAEGDEEEAQMTVDWGTTVDAKDEFGTEHEAPEGATVEVTVGGDKVGDFATTATWQNVPGCGLILEPASLKASGSIGDGTSRLALDDFRLAIPRDSGTFSFSGKVSAASGSDSLSFRWGFSANGRAERNAISCFIEDVDVDSGSVDIGVSANEESFGLAFDFSGVELDADQNLQSVGVSRGELKVNGSVAVAFEGTLGSSGSFGDNLDLRFSNGEEMTLKEFLQLNVSTFASMAVRRTLR